MGIIIISIHYMAHHTFQTSTNKEKCSTYFQIPCKDVVAYSQIAVDNGRAVLDPLTESMALLVLAMCMVGYPALHSTIFFFSDWHFLILSDWTKDFYADSRIFYSTNPRSIPSLCLFLIE